MASLWFSNVKAYTNKTPHWTRAPVIPYSQKCAKHNVNKLPYIIVSAALKSILKAGVYPEVVQPWQLFPKCIHSITYSITITEATIKTVKQSRPDYFIIEAYTWRVLRKITVHRQELILPFISLYLSKKYTLHIFITKIESIREDQSFKEQIISSSCGQRSHTTSQSQWTWIQTSYLQ